MSDEQKNENLAQLVREYNDLKQNAVHAETVMRNAVTFFDGVVRHLRFPLEFPDGPPGPAISEPAKPDWSKMPAPQELSSLVDELKRSSAQQKKLLADLTALGVPIRP